MGIARHDRLYAARASPGFPEGRLCGLIADCFDDEHVACGVNAIGKRPVDDTPWPRSIRQAKDIAELRFANGTGGPIAAHDLRRVELASLASPHTPHDAAHDNMFARML